MRFLVYYPTLKLLLNLAFIQEVHPLAEKVHAVLLLKKIATNLLSGNNLKLLTLL